MPLHFYEALDISTKYPVFFKEGTYTGQLDSVKMAASWLELSKNEIEIKHPKLAQAYIAVLQKLSHAFQCNLNTNNPLANIKNLLMLRTLNPSSEFNLLLKLVPQQAT